MDVKKAKFTSGTEVQDSTVNQRVTIFNVPKGKNKQPEYGRTNLSPFTSKEYLKTTTRKSSEKHLRCSKAKELLSQRLPVDFKDRHLSSTVPSDTANNKSKKRLFTHQNGNPINFAISHTSATSFCRRLERIQPTPVLNTKNVPNLNPDFIQNNKRVPIVILSDVLNDTKLQNRYCSKGLVNKCYSLGLGRKHTASVSACNEVTTRLENLVTMPSKLRDEKKLGITKHKRFKQSSKLKKPEMQSHLSEVKRISPSVNDQMDSATLKCSMQEHSVNGKNKNMNPETSNLKPILKHKGQSPKRKSSIHSVLKKASKKKWKSSERTAEITQTFAELEETNAAAQDAISPEFLNSLHLKPVENVHSNSEKLRDRRLNTYNENSKSPTTNDSEEGPSSILLSPTIKRKSTIRSAPINSRSKSRTQSLSQYKFRKRKRNVKFKNEVPKQFKNIKATVSNQNSDSSDSMVYTKNKKEKVNTSNANIELNEDSDAPVLRKRKNKLLFLSTTESESDDSEIASIHKTKKNDIFKKTMKQKGDKLENISKSDENVPVWMKINEHQNSSDENDSSQQNSPSNIIECSTIKSPNCEESQKNKRNHTQNNNLGQLRRNPLNFVITQNLLSPGNRIVETKSVSNVADKFNKSQIIFDKEDNDFSNAEDSQDSTASCASVIGTLDYSNHEVLETYRGCWAEQYKLFDDDVIHIVSHDGIFEGAQLSPEDCLVDIINCKPEKKFTNASDAKLITSPPQERISDKYLVQTVKGKQNNIVVGEKSSSKEQGRPSTTDNSVGISNLKYTLEWIKNVQRDQEKSCNVSNSIKNVDKFKTPLLPCDKRPSTRPKSNVIDSENDVSQSVDQSNLQGEEDAISLFAESLCDKEVDEILNARSSPVPPNAKLSNTSAKDNSVAADARLPKVNDLTKSWPQMFYSYCYFHYNSNCKYVVDNCVQYCKRKHFFPPSFRFKLMGLPINKLRQTYLFTKVRPKMFNELLGYFIDAFTHLQCPSDLLNIIPDIMQKSTENKVAHIEKVTAALVKLGYSFRKAVMALVVQPGIDNNMSLIDILIDMICKNKRDLCQNWLVINILISSQKEYVDHGLVSELLNECIKTKNVELCKNIMKDIISTDKVKLDMISTEILYEFYTLLTSLELVNEAKILQPKINSFMGRMIEMDLPNVIEDHHDLSISQPKQFEETVTSNSDPINAWLLSNGQLNNIQTTAASEISSAGSNCSYYLTRNDPSPSSNYNVDSETPNQIFDIDKNHLMTIIDSKDVQEFWKMLEKFKNSVCHILFIQHAINGFRKEHPSDIVEMLINVVNIFNHRYVQDENLKGMLGMLHINLMPIFEQSRKYKEAATVLAHFNDPRTLVNTEWSNVHTRKYTEAGKYIYLLKIFVKGGHFQQALDILLSEDLNLLSSSRNWSLENESVDIISRDQITTDFILATLEKNIYMAKEVIVTIISVNSATGIKIWKYFNNLVLKMINAREIYLKDIKSLLGNILEGWFHYLTKSVIRGLVITMARECSIEEFNKLYNLCSKKAIYPTVKGNDRILTVTTDQTTQEVAVIIYIFLTETLKNPYEIDDLIIQITLLNPPEEEPNLLLSGNPFIQIMKTRICTTLASCFNYTINVFNDVDEPFIKIEKGELQRVIKLYCESKIDIW